MVSVHFGSAILFVLSEVLLLVGAATLGVEHTVNFGKTDIHIFLEESKEKALRGEISKFSTVATTHKTRKAAPVEARPWTARELETFVADDPDINITLVTNGKLLIGVSIDFTDNSTLSTPDFRVAMSYVDDVQHERYVLQPSEVQPEMASESHYLALHSPFSLTETDNLRVQLFVFPRVVTTYRYDIDPEQLVPGTNESIANGLLFELTPSFSTMRIMFLAQRRGDVFALWITRRPPMPRCTVIATTGDKVLFVEHVHAASPWGVALRNVLLGLPQQYSSSIRLTVHFYERRRSRTAHFTIPDLGNTIKSLESSSAKKPIVPTDVEGMTLRATLSTDKKALSLWLSAPSPISNAMVQLRIGSTHVYCNEAEHPIIGEAYEFSKVFSLDVSKYAALATDAIVVQGQLLFDWQKYNENSEDMLRHWVHTYGGNLRGVYLSQVSQQDKRSNSSSVLRVRVPLAMNTQAAYIPYTLLLTSTIAASNPAVQELQNDTARTQILEDECKKLGIHFPSVLPLVLLSYYVMLGEPHPTTGMPWRPLYESIPLREPPLTPLFYTSEELNLFSFEPSVKRSYERTLALFRAEYAAIAAHAPWLVALTPKEALASFPRRWSAADYYALRSQLSSRALNMSGELTLVPALNNVALSSTPTAILHFNNVLQGVECITQRNMAAGDELSVYLESHDRSRVDFLFQHGILSRQQSPDAIEIAYTQKSGAVFNATLTASRSSTAPLMAAILEDHEDPREARFAFIKLLNSAIKALGTSAPTFGDVSPSLRRNTIEEVAASLFNGRKELLHIHLRWISDA